MAEFISELLGKRRNRISTSSDDSTSSPDNKKSRKSISTDGEIAEEDTILTALDMTANMAKKLEEILERLKKLDVIESSVKSIETKLNCLEERTAVLENFRQTTEKDINDLKENGNFTSSQLSEISTELKNHQAAITDLTQKAEASKELLKELTAKNLYLEAYSRRENIRFMNIKDGSSDEPEDVEETLRDFLERELGFHDARSVEIQRVHRSGKSKNGKPRPILARFLRYKDVQKIFSLGHRLRETDFQMFCDYPAEIVRRRKEQMKTFKEARRNNIPAFFSLSEPDKLFIRGRVWPVGKKLIINPETVS